MVKWYLPKLILEICSRTLTGFKTRVNNLDKKYNSPCNQLTDIEHFDKKCILKYQIDSYELELVTGCLRGERLSQRALYDRYKDAMYTILYRMLDTEEDAADSLQDAFIEIFKSLKNFKKRSSLGAWIKTIVIRKGIHKQKHRIVFDELTSKHEYQQLESWDENLNGEYLEKGIMSLSPGYRSVFLLIEVEGYSHKEAAEMLNISVGTSKSQLARGKKILQKKLKELMY